MRILVAGGTGFIGSAIVRRLAGAGHAVTVLSRRPRPRLAAVEHLAGDVTDRSTFRGKLAGFDVLVDAAQFPNSPIENPKKGWTFERVDLGGTKNLVDEAREAGVHHYIDLSGVGAAPNARYHWFRCKWEEEQYIAASGLGYTVFRPSWVYGPGDNSLNRFLSFARFLPFVPVVGNGKMRVNPVFVEDVAAHVQAAVERGPQNAVFEIGGPEVLTMDDVIRTALRVAGKRRFLLHQPVPLMKAVAAVAQFLPGRPLTPDAIDFITQDAVADIGPLRATFGLELTPLVRALETYLRG
ncbi:MAG: NAD-dependent epimerase/dehydratase family protein [Chloroflexota bacterium]|nr:NAD-dependent epimerase/dehydratase family protein [Chloroflexota bacterium]